MHSIREIRYTEEEIKYKRHQVAEYLLARSIHVKGANLTAISDRDLQLLFEGYDKVFFANWFKEFFPGILQFSFSRRMTKSAGKTYYPKDADPARPESLVIQVKISIDMIFAYGKLEKANQVGGLTTQNSLEALQLVLEHELTHVIEFIHFQNSSCKGKRFKTIAHNLFGHTESYHCLPTNQQIARQKLGLAVGDSVAFSFQGRIMKGILNAIHKRAVVMVPDKQGAYVDRRGQRYTKYYVPLQMLNKE
jgi:hypothetical protein